MVGTILERVFMLFWVSPCSQGDLAILYLVIICFFFFPVAVSLVEKLFFHSCLLVLNFSLLAERDWLQPRGGSSF